MKSTNFKCFLYWKYTLVNSKLHIKTFLILFSVLLFNPVFSQSKNEEIGKRLDTIYGYSQTDYKRTIIEAEKLLADIDRYESSYDKAVILLAVGNLQITDGSTDKGLENIKKALNLIRDKGYTKLYSRARAVLARFYYQDYQYEKAFENFNELIGQDDFGSGENKDFLYTHIRTLFALLNEKIGREQEALRLYLQADAYADELGTKLIQPSYKQSLAISIANLYHSFGQIDSAHHYINRYNQNVKKFGETLAKEEKTLYEGNVYLLDGDFAMAIQKYSIVKEFSKKEYDEFDDDLILKKSRAHLELGQLDSTLSNLKIIATDKDFAKKEPYMNPEYYKLYAEVYDKKGMKALSEANTEKYLTAKENFNSFKFNTLDELHSLNTQELKATERSEKRILHNYINYLWFALGGILATGILLFILKQRKDNKRFKALMLRNNIEKNIELGQKDVSETSNTVALKDEKVEELIRQIALLNEEGFFLKQKTTLYNTAKKLKTNTSYLSNVVNNHLNTNFNTFVNDIRIDYIINELQINKQMRSYSVKAIAEEIGYKSADSFTKYFKQNTGLSPSVFIKNINKEH